MESLVEINNTQFWKDKRVLITGHTGFKGSWLLILLNRLGANIVGMALEDYSQESLFNKINVVKNLSFHNIYSDIRDRGNLGKIIRDFSPQIVIHLAAQPLVRESYLQPIETYEINTMGSLYVLEALKEIKNKCAVIMVTTDKVYQNKEMLFGYRENDILGGYDPYSASKAAAELVISSWRSSYGEIYKNIKIASVRSGNVIGGGDYSKDRIIPDCVRAINKNETLEIRSPLSKRPWQHVLEPLNGYLMLAQKLFENDGALCEAYNFGPQISSNKTVKELVDNFIDFFPGNCPIKQCENTLHETNVLNLNIDKAYFYLSWQPVWDFQTTIKKTALWYKSIQAGGSAFDECINDIESYEIKLKQSNQK